MNKVYVGNLPFRVTPQEVRDLFASCGEIVDVFLVKDRATGKMKGFGFVSFATAAAAQAALKLDNQSLGGRNIKVSFAKEKTGQESM